MDSDNGSEHLKLEELRHDVTKRRSINRHSSRPALYSVYKCIHLYRFWLVAEMKFPNSAAKLRHLYRQCLEVHKRMSLHSAALHLRESERSGLHLWREERLLVGECSSAPGKLSMVSYIDGRGCI